MDQPSSPQRPQMVSRSMRFHESGVEDNETTDELSRVTPEEVHRPFNYNSDTGVEYRRQEDGPSSPSTRRHVYYGPGGHYNATHDSSSDDEGAQTAPYASQWTASILPYASTFHTPLRQFSIEPAPSGSSFAKINRYTRRTRMRNMKKFREGTGAPPRLLRVSAYCTCESMSLFKLLKWLNWVPTRQLPGGELNPNGWTHKMHMGAIHSSCKASIGHDDDDDDDATSHVVATDDQLAIERKDVFYFATGCTVFWGLSRTEEQAHIHAIRAFSKASVKQVEVEDMDFCYGATSSVMNDVITLSSFRSSEKIAISFAMAQSCKLDVFEERVEDSTKETRHIPQTLANTGEIKKYSQKDISQLIGRLFIERSDINLNSDMLDDPDFFWDDDEYQPLYKNMIKYLDVANRVHILNTRLDVLRELLDVLSEQLERQHATKLEWIVIWLIVAEVVVKAHIHAIRAFSKASVKHMEVEDMDFCYGATSSVMNDVITLSSFRSSEKIAISFAMAQSCKLDVFEERVEDSTKETRHIPQTLADTGEIKKYSQKDISQLIGRLFIERSDINLNSDMLDDPDFFWDDDEYQPLYKNMIKYLDVANRVHILNTRLDVLRELLDVLSEQLERQHATKLEWIVIWLIVAEVVVKVFWSILVKDILGFFDHHGGIE
ncbi:hypothetical protein H257_12797 [Aphanomyces astaci]|uniref:DUF155 domain-containing protein n=2 Tax=Aphanomyces astaci TaxID=112090 RepID=W4FWT7_APHAT|nr:hypothetical protein H257_12797 [Aphanomyces astaci]ETV71985.1 hypothetical protein H257_12797 [Aphanomyces astaci]|eukprot:XP_009838428.1 hypothetical protein H257_12797 [Aphanomyces astaci]